MDGHKAVSLKGSFRKVRKVFLILLPYVIVCRLKVSVFKEFKLNIVINVVCRRKVNSLSLLLLTFADLLTNICHTMSVVYSGWKGLIVVCKGG